MEVLDYSIFPERRVVYAGFWTRFAAVFIDGLILAVVGMIVRLIIGGNSEETIIHRIIFQSTGTAAGITNLVIGWLYDALQESSPWMATIGKRAMRVRVTNLNGERISFGQATGRHFGKYISTIILLIGYFMMLWDEKKQTLHDKMAGTLVVQD